MRRLLIIFLLLLAGPSYAMQMIGFGAGATCDTQSYDVQYATYNTSSVFDPTNQTRGQSWQSGATGTLYSITIRRHSYTYDASNITIRIGTGTNLSGTCSLSNTCKVQYTCAISDSTGDKECVIPEGSRPTLTSGNTYYFLMMVSYGYSFFDISRDAAAGYANGTAYFESAEDWDVTGSTSSSDYPFKTRMCD